MEKKHLIFLILMAFWVSNSSTLGEADFPQDSSHKSSPRILKLKEILKIPGEGDGYFFNGANSLRLDGSKNIYVGDSWASSQRSHLLKFTRKGQFIKDLYKQGEGPGEIQSMYAFELAGPEIYLFDFLKRKIVLTDLDGTFLSEHKPDFKFTPDFIGICDNSLVFLHEKYPVERKQTKIYDIDHVILLLSKNGETQKELYSFSCQTFLIAFSQGGGMMTWDPFITSLTGARLYVCHTRKFQIKALDLKTGEILFDTSIPYDRVPHESRDWEKDFVKKYDAPSQKFESDISGLLSSADTLWVKTSTKTAEKGTLYHIFDLNGKLKDSFFLDSKCRIVAIDGNVVYSSETDSEDLPYLVKYEILRDNFPM